MNFRCVSMGKTGTNLACVSEVCVGCGVWGVGSGSSCSLLLVEGFQKLEINQCYRTRGSGLDC